MGNGVFANRLVTVVTFYMIATPSTLLLSERASNQLTLKPCACRTESKFECSRGTLGAVSQGRVLVKDHSLWRTLAAAGDEGLNCALSYRAKSPR